MIGELSRPLPRPVSHLLSRFRIIQKRLDLLAPLSSLGKSAISRPKTIRASSASLKPDAIQLRYVHDDQDWIDTLLREGEGVQLTRIMVTFEEGP